jgi:hypothetical protein
MSSIYTPLQGEGGFMKLPVQFWATCLVFGFMAQGAFAATNQLLLRGTSDDFPGNLDLDATVLANGDVSAIHTVNPKGTKDYPISQLATGIVLFNSGGHDVITIKSTNFDVAHGGTVNLSYLTNGITGDYDSTELTVQHVGSQWELLINDQAGLHVITKAFFQSRKFFGQAIGIDSIDWQ